MSKKKQIWWKEYESPQSCVEHLILLRFYATPNACDVHTLGFKFLFVTYTLICIYLHIFTYMYIYTYIQRCQVAAWKTTRLPTISNNSNSLFFNQPLLEASAAACCVHDRLIEYFNIIMIDTILDLRSD